MVQLKVLSGQKAGTAWTARRFPVKIGRSASADLRSEEPGIWDQHLRLDFDPAEAANMMKVQIDARLRTPSELRMLDDHAPLTDADYAEFDRLFGSKNQTPAPKGLPA